MPYEFVLFSCFLRVASQMMSISILSTIGKYLFLIWIFLRRSQYYSMARSTSHLSHYVIIKEINLMRGPESRWEDILIMISNSTPSKQIRSPLIQLAIFCNSCCMVLVNIHIHEFNFSCIIGTSSKNRFCCHIISTT